jgi:peptidoglycan/LPS O-acetylase OafA/YrhL
VGWIGVQIFFVLSGFLITGQLLASIGARNYLSSFYARRALRILPLYYLSLIIALVIIPSVAQLPPEVLATHDQQLWLWLFLNNWTQPFHGAVYGFPHFWSLAVEEQFYLVWPFLVMWSGGGRRLVVVCIATAALALVFRALSAFGGLPPDATYMFTVGRMDALAVGAGAAVLARDHRMALGTPRVIRLLWWSAVCGLAAGTLMTHVFDLQSPSTILIGYPLLALITAAVILLCLERRGSLFPDLLGTLLSFRPLRSVGRYSYAMYIAHMPMILLLGDTLQKALREAGLASPYWYLVIFVALTYLVAMTSYALIEKHFLSLKARFRPIRDECHALQARH